MQDLGRPVEVDPSVADLEALTRVLVGIAWDSAHAAPPGVTFPQTRLLLILESLGRVSCSTLASALGVSASSVTRLADRLAAHGYLVRGTDEHKRSVVTIEVTESGRRIVAQVLDRRHGALEAVLDNLPPAHRTSVATAARRLCDAAAAVPSIGTSGPGPL